MSCAGAPAKQWPEGTLVRERPDEAVALVEVPQARRTWRSSISPRFGSAADYQPGCVAGPDGSREVDRASAPVLVDVLAYEHRGV